MKRIQAFTALSQVPSATLNSMQDRAVGAGAANSNNAIASTVLGGEMLYWQGEVVAGQLIKIDGYNDWKDRLVMCWTRVFDINTNRIGQSGDDNPNSWAGTDLSGYDSDIVKHSDGWLGTGAYSNITTGTAVSNGNPPLNDTGAYRSYTMAIADHNTTGYILLYADPTTGALYLYNTHGSTTVYVLVKLIASNKTGLR